jgi:hypothetical protein
MLQQMKPAGRARTKARKNATPEGLDEAFDAQQRWLLIGIGVLLAVALISFALDWFRDPIVHRVLLILLAIAGVGVVVVIPLGLGGTAVFWRRKLRADRVGPGARGRRVPRATYVIGLGDGRDIRTKRNELWNEQNKWRWRPVALAVIVGGVAIAMPRQWQSSSAVRLFYLAMMMAFAVTAYVWMRKWFAYWAEVRRPTGITFWGARREVFMSWWNGHLFYGRLTALGFVALALVGYLGWRWPNGGVADGFLIGTLAAAAVASRVSRRQ